MALTSRQALDSLVEYLDTQDGVGTLQVLQRAVLAKGYRALERDGHWPVMDFPLAIHRAIGGDDAAGRVVAGTCALFYGFADVIDDAQDHDLAEDPWATWGWEQAVNTGTSLLFLSLRHLTDGLPPERAAAVSDLFVRAGLEMTHGQHVDLHGQGHPAPSWPLYLQVIERKSGASFGAYAQAMAIACGVGLERSLPFRDFGRALGMLFQMWNDTYELWGPRLSPDYANQRLTLPIVLALEQFQPAARAQLERILGEPASLQGQQELVQLLEASGVRGYVTVRIEVYRKRAQALARSLGLDTEPYLNELLEIPAFPDFQVAI